MISITAPEIKDVEEIAMVRIITWQDAYADLIKPEYLDSLFTEESINRYKDWVLKHISEEITFIAKEDDKILGFVVGRKSSDHDLNYDAELGGFYLLPEYQNQGIGKKLFLRFVKEIVKRNMSSMFLWCLKGNKTTDIYKKLGGVYVKEDVIEIGNVMYKKEMYGFDDLDTLKND
ncbi:MAG: GNAT family N-acetyltransferase [Proteobacteria bacterium]|nr:GNAT family N-acetyltransferase [Pseudomonadota bacterium]